MTTRARSAVRRAALVAAAALAPSLLVVPPAPAVPVPPTEYVALGDSYSSGTGTGDYLDDGTDCLRSVAAYPALVATAGGYDLNFRACSGATVWDVRTLQLDALGPGTAYVSVSAGGNDAGFADVLTECAKPAWFSDCYGAIDDARAFIGTYLPRRLNRLYRDIRAAAPVARVTVAGYPRIFGSEDCNLLTFFSGTERSRLNGLADLVAQVTRETAGSNGFTFADPRARFEGHAVCDEPEWINGLSLRLEESYHPDADGHALGYTPTVAPSLTSSTLLRRPRLLARRADSATFEQELAREQRTYAGRDAAIEKEVVRLPDLTSPAATRGAARRGIDVTDPREVARADRRASRAQHRAWLADRGGR